jgi:transposase
MRQGTLLPDTAEVELGFLRPKDGTIQMHLRACRASAVCPECQTISWRVHSRYARELGDLPWEGIPVRVYLQTRKFFCGGRDCRRRIFTERLPNTVLRYARRTRRSSEALDWITLALGGEAGSRLARRMGLLVDGSTLLRQLRQRSSAATARAPRVLGIDDWAWRKGHRYGTILCDLESRRVVDLLPDRESETVATWLRTHPGVEVVSRDRASAYAEAVRKAAPQAVQVADRWHLLRNLSEALTSTLQPHHRILTQTTHAIRALEAPPPAVPPAVHAEPRAALMQVKNRERRHSLYEQGVDLARHGMSQIQIGRQLGLDRRTVRRWMRSNGFPERKQGHRISSVEAHAQYLEQRLQQGCHNATQLWREIRERGFHGRQSIVRTWIRQRRGPRYQPGEHAITAPALRTSPRHTARWILTKPASAQPYLEELYRRSPEIAATARAANEFFRIVRSRDSTAWPSWLQSAKGTALASFAAHLIRDQAAVLAALETPWSNGQVEGQVHRLKLVKRQMYGRASFDLLRLRVLNRA